MKIRNYNIIIMSSMDNIYYSKVTNHYNQKATIYWAIILF